MMMIKKTYYNSYCDLLIYFVLFSVDTQASSRVVSHSRTGAVRCRLFPVYYSGGVSAQLWYGVGSSGASGYPKSGHSAGGSTGTRTKPE